MIENTQRKERRHENKIFLENDSLGSDPVNNEFQHST